MALGDQAIGWSRPDFDLERPDGFDALLLRDRPALVIHAASMTAVDDAARDPGLAMRLNGAAVGVLAEACRRRGSGLLVVSTNEVFDGERTDGVGYDEADEPRPRNPYGLSKLAGEQAALDAFGGRPRLWIVRTSWLFGPPGNDFPAKILNAIDRLPADHALPVVADEFGCPTYTVDLAQAIVGLVRATDGGLFHLVNAAPASRLEWAQRVLAVCRPGRRTVAISRSDYARASDPPPWGVLRSSRLPTGLRPLRPWYEALDEYSVARWLKRAAESAGRAAAVSRAAATPDPLPRPNGRRRGTGARCRRRSARSTRTSAGRCELDTGSRPHGEGRSRPAPTAL